MRLSLVMLLCLISANASAACDRDAVKIERSSMQGFGTWNGDKPVVDFHWRIETHDMPAVIRVALMKQFAGWGRCVYGNPRAVDFYLGNKLIAHTSTDGQYRAATEDFEDGSQTRLWFKFNGN